MELNNPAISQTPLPLPSAGCRNCGAAPEMGYALPLCEPCRTGLVGRPFPKWIVVVAVLVGVAVIYASMRIPASLSAAVAFERGQKDEQTGKFEPAITEYSKVVARYPSSTEAIGRLSLAEFKGGRWTDAAHELTKLQGVKIDNKSLLAELNDEADHLRPSTP